MKKYFLLFFIIGLCATVFANDTLIQFKSTWKYLDDGSNQDATMWKLNSFNDATWASGAGELGYGETDQSTTVNAGCTPVSTCSNKFITTYFRKKITITNPNQYIGFKFDCYRDDGIVVYVNGVLVYTENMPSTFTSASVAASNCADDGNNIQTTTIAATNFINGDNTIAVEIHQVLANSSDISFDLRLVALTTANAPLLTRGPYLQLGTETAISLRWRTDVPTNSVVQYGATATTLTSSVTDNTVTTEHELRITGLTADTKYFYNIGSTTNILQGDANNYFVTLPVANATRKIRVAVFGDCGNGSANQTNVKNQALSYLGANHPDAWILLGDNAYSEGTDVQFQALFFDMYKNDILKNWKLYPAPGNHDYGNTQANSGVRNNDYYKNFTVPTAAEAGGVASGTEAYYSFDVGNTHFISLDSYGKENGNTTRLYDTTGAQVVWLKQDLAANTKRWTVVYFHHPPYTMGSHNSDAETELLLIRQNFIRILERFGVDLVLCGHSHNYERSYLLKDYFTDRASFNVATHTADASSAKYDGSANSCPYKYLTGKLNHGTVYVVAGSAGQSGGIQPSGLYPHPALPFEYTSNTIGGSLMLEFEDNRLDAKMIGADGLIKDQFTIMKDVAKKTIVNIVSGNSLTLNASWIGSYNWTPTSATTRSINVNPTNNTFYYVSDNAGCIKDTFDVRLITLPLRQFVLSAKQMDQQLTLQWQTLNEQQVASFEVQESVDGQSFATIAKLPSKGNSASGFTYQHKKLILQAGKYYYRIKAVSKDGSEQLSNMIVQDLTGQNYLTIVPNIVHQGQIAKLLLHNSTQIKSLDLVSVDGKNILQIAVQAQIELKTTDLLPAVYYLRLLLKDGRTFIEKLVVN